MAALLCASLAGGGLGACGGDEGGGGAGTSRPRADSPVKLRIGETAGIPYAFLKFGVDKGFYRDAGLDVQAVPVQGAAPIVASVVSGDYQLGGSDTATLTQALARRLPLTMIAPGTSVSRRKANDFSALMVSPKSGIREPRDLRGKTIAVNILGNITEVTLSGALERLGVDPKTIRYTELPFPEMAAAVEKGRVDGAFIIEPFRTIGAAAGLKSLFGPFSSFQPGMQIGSIIATERYAERNPGVISSFQKAHAQTARYIATHEAEFRRALPKVAQLKPALAQKVKLPVWKENVDPPSVQRVSDAMARFGLVKRTPNVRGAIRDGA